MTTYSERLVFTDGNLRKDIFRYYLQSADLINRLEYQQRRKYEILNRFNEIVRQIKMNTPGIAQQDAENKAIDYGHADNKEYQDLMQSIPKLINKLNQHKLKAETLLTRLENEN